MERVIQFLRAHRWARRSLSALSVALVVLAVGLLGYPVYTNYQHDRLQKRLGNELTGSDVEQRYRTRKLRIGDPLTRIKIPSLGVDTVVVHGTTDSALRAGAGHYPNTPLPCEKGNVSIAGHRTTFGKPFAALEQLRPGDRITLETPVGSCTYAVEPTPAPFKATPGMEAAWIVAPTDLRVIDQDPSKGELTLTTCHPKGSDRQRLIVRAHLVDTGEVRR